MGYIKHDAIIVTSFALEYAEHARRTAQESGLTVSDLVRSPENGYVSFLVVPDGSKEGWAESTQGEVARDAWKHAAAEFYRNGTYVDWVHVAYAGDEPSDTKIVDDSEHGTRPPTEHQWRSMDDEQRLQFLARFPCCRHCGSIDVGCQCWNDE